MVLAENQPAFGPIEVIRVLQRTAQSHPRHREGRFDSQAISPGGLQVSAHFEKTCSAVLIVSNGASHSDFHIEVTIAKCAQPGGLR